MIQNSKAKIALLTVCSFFWGQVHGAVKKSQDAKGKDAAGTASKSTASKSSADELEETLKRITVDNALREAKLARALAAEREALERLKCEKEKLTLQWEIVSEKKRISHEKELLALKMKTSKSQAQAEALSAQLATMKQQFEIKQLALERQTKRVKASAEYLQAEVARIVAQENRANHTGNIPQYTTTPLINGILSISDRCIKLDGVITVLQANYVVDQIQFFDNKNPKAPIFILMTECWGGSCQAGYRILQAMRSSHAPVYVVVKGFTASMGAIIATLANKSYALPSARILHHEASTGMWGNKRDMEATMNDLRKWGRLLDVPVAKKMGISLRKLNDKFVQSPRRNCWIEFAAEARKLKWVDHVIQGIQYTGIQSRPQRGDYTWKKLLHDFFGPWESAQQACEKKAGEKTVVMLPSLAPGDYYRVYNPEGRFQVMQ